MMVGAVVILVGTALVLGAARAPGD
jgi:hypothetical protein